MNWADRVRAYERGFRNGHLDAFSGVWSIIALTAPDTDYAMGYREGQDRTGLRIKGRRKVENTGTIP